MELSIKNMLNRRRVVVHHTQSIDKCIMKSLNSNDIVFFDDCVYSQYLFIKENSQNLIDKNIDCILGFSSGLYANSSASQIECIDTASIHRACNATITTIDDADRLRSNLHEMLGFMTIDQLKELLEFPFCHLALHGCCHLHLEEVQSIVDKSRIFLKDLIDGQNRLKALNLKTSIYVYPYVYSFIPSDKFLIAHGMKTIIGSTVYRIPVESLVFNRNIVCNS